jgi:hypothetical protein
MKHRIIIISLILLCGDLPVRVSAELQQRGSCIPNIGSGHTGCAGSSNYT